VHGSGTFMPGAASRTSERYLQSPSAWLRSIRLSWGVGELGAYIESSIEDRESEQLLRRG
jgi:hypothetical protein